MFWSDENVLNLDSGDSQVCEYGKQNRIIYF
jgi:hypothetical protein